MAPRTFRQLLLTSGMFLALATLRYRFEATSTCLFFFSNLGRGSSFKVTVCFN
jgi:hypothetical protein